MKKHIVLAAVAVLVAGVTATMALAGEGQESRERHRGNRRKAAGKHPGANPKAVFDKVLKSLELSEEQAQRVEQIWTTHRQAVENWTKEHQGQFKELYAQTRKAKEDKDTEALRAVREKMRKLTESRKRVAEDLFKQLGGVLNDEQMAKVRRAMHHRGVARRPNRMMAAFKDLDLTEEQKARMKAIREETKGLLEKAKTREEKGKILRESFSKAGEVLTEEQRRKLKELIKRQRRQHDPLAGLDLTTEQKKQVEAIRKEMREKMADAKDREARLAIHKEMREKIGQVLTDEQKKQLRENIAKRRYRDRSGKRPWRANMMAMIERLDLTEDQKARMKSIRQATRSRLEEARTREEKRKIFRDSAKEINEILTDDQRKKLDELIEHRRRANDPLAGLNLTKKQREQIEAIRKEMHEKMAGAEDREARRAIHKEMREKIGQVLTEDQRTRLREKMHKFRQGRRRRHPGKEAPRSP